MKRFLLLFTFLSIIFAQNIVFANNETDLVKKTKSDNTPVTNGDIEVNNILTKKISELTPEIPIATGPSWYGGLPGLILEISDDKTTVLCTKIVMNPTEKTKIKRPKKGKVIATSDFLVLQDAKRIEAREMWNKSRARGGSARLNR